MNEIRVSCMDSAACFTPRGFTFIQWRIQYLGGGGDKKYLGGITVFAGKLRRGIWENFEPEVL